MICPIYTFKISHRLLFQFNIIKYLLVPPTLKEKHCLPRNSQSIIYLLKFLPWRLFSILFVSPTVSICLWRTSDGWSLNTSLPLQSYNSRVLSSQFRNEWLIVDSDETGLISVSYQKCPALGREEEAHMNKGVASEAEKSSFPSICRPL